jgi:hypothetical protein
MAYRLRNLFCRLAGTLHSEREAFYQAVGECNEKEGMARGTLLTPLSIANYSPERREAVDSNIRVSEFFLLVVEDIWEVSVQAFLHDYRLARKCCGDANLPMRAIAVFVKRTPPDEEAGELAQFRAGLASAGGIRCCEFEGVEEFRALLTPLLSQWLAVETVDAAGW